MILSGLHLLCCMFSRTLVRPPHYVSQSLHFPSVHSSCSDVRASSFENAPFDFAGAFVLLVQSPPRVAAGQQSLLQDSFFDGGQSSILLFSLSRTQLGCRLSQAFAKCHVQGVVADVKCRLHGPLHSVAVPHYGAAPSCRTVAQHRCTAVRQSTAARHYMSARLLGTKAAAVVANTKSYAC
jgi:hypothetical protein